MTVTILIVDDLPDIIQALRRQFARRAHVVTASSVAEALAILDATEVTLLLTDYQMPGRDGLDLLREAHRRWPRTRRFLTSGDEVPGIKDLLAGGLVEMFLPKPTDLAAIFAVLTTAQPG